MGESDKLSERKLLEAAAKAAGYVLCFWWDGVQTFVIANAARGGCPRLGGEQWNPLRSDGDAFRLAVKLHINIYNVTGKHASASCYLPDMGVVSYYNEKGSDPYAATRLAITRAAAALSGGATAPGEGKTR